MCGIAGTWSRCDSQIVERMLDDLHHRGPDDHGRYSNDRAVLGHRRLSIVDCEGGHQPILNENASAATIVNGEIYNAADLRQTLSRSRHRFRSASDSEAPLHLYEDVGPRAVHSLNGMFALAIASGDALFLARDPIGIKPLYVSINGDAISFSSELKALRFESGTTTEFPPGTWFRSDLGFQRYYRVPHTSAADLPLASLRVSLRDAINRAVEKRLMSDVTLGTFLSGGLDSSIITALVRPHVSSLHTIAVGMEGTADLEAARCVARDLDTIHHEHMFTADDVLEALPTVIYHLESFDVDLVRSAIPCYFASCLASDHMKVVLTGEGADELFAGYRYHKNFRHENTLHDELTESVAALHNMNLQRVDRMTMAHSIEGRVPFLDTDVIAFALRIPIGLKLRGSPPIEKWILREAFDDLLPDAIVWREKTQFDEGTGTASLLSKLTPTMADHFGVSSIGVSSIRELEERVYRALFRHYFPKSAERLVARWRGGHAEECWNDHSGGRVQDL